MDSPRKAQQPERGKGSIPSKMRDAAPHPPDKKNKVKKFDEDRLGWYYDRVVSERRSLSEEKKKKLLTKA